MKKTMIFTAILMMVFMVSCVKPDDDPKPDVALTCSVSSTNVTVNGGTDGTISVTVNTGTAPFDYNLSKDNVNCGIDKLASYDEANTFVDLSAGTYKVIVTDDNDKTFTKDVTLTQPAIVLPEVTFTAVATDASVYGASDGKITVTVNTGTPNYTYSKDGVNFQPSNEFTGLAAATYSITVKDANNKTANKSVTVNQPAEVINDLVCNVTFVNATVSGNDGSITVNVTSGNAPYTYTLSGVTPETTSATTKTFSNLSTGTYTVTVTDNKSKTFTASVTIITKINVGDSYLGGIVIIVNSNGISGVIMKTTDEPSTYTQSEASTQLISIGYRFPSEAEFRAMLTISGNNLSTSNRYWIEGIGKFMTYNTVDNTWVAATTTSSTIKYNVRGVKTF